MSLYVDIEKQLGSFSLRVRFTSDGGTLGLLGPSGSGKSMTLKCIAGIEHPDRGRIVLDDVVLFDSEQKIDLPPQKRQVGYLFQNYALFPNMTVRQNILCGLRRETDPKEQEAQLRRAIALMRLEGTEELRPFQLSGGQAQRAALARILVSKPRLLLLDEPFSALDTHLREHLQLCMKELLERFGYHALLVTHSRDEAYDMCSRIAVIDAGELLTLKETKALFADPESRQAARLTGCKNVEDARRSGEHELFIPAWGIHLRTALPVREDVQAVAIRAHYFNPKTEVNRFPVQYLNQIEEPFQLTLQFRWDGQDPDSNPLWWRLSKDRRPDPLPAALGIAPVNVLPLYR